ncbi:hypothetical protein [Thioalkalivibrio thiocyanodenitrificans]|uniref:hypothetical protein n=1 Tax=Thioalkalivibrio thiocyanodenitrificans TaxID=243063 RepID=UPI0012EAA94E|nr:hypothetical protein [Thioalkalivibrio thiocyanodenitrificans]
MRSPSRNQSQSGARRPLTPETFRPDPRRPFAALCRKKTTSAAQAGWHVLAQEESRFALNQRIEAHRANPVNFGLFEYRVLA